MLVAAPESELRPERERMAAAGECFFTDDVAAMVNELPELRVACYN
jgi:hypothetical protein